MDKRYIDKSMNVLNSDLKSSIEYFVERMNSFHSESHFREYYQNAIWDILLVDQYKTLEFIKNLDSEKYLPLVSISIPLLALIYPNWRITKAFKEQVDKYPNSPNRKNLLMWYEKAVDNLNWYRQDKVYRSQYFNMSTHAHTERNLKYLRSQGFVVNIECIYPNGVRLGSVPMHPDEKYRENMTWFPASWKLRDLDEAVKFVYEQHKSTFADLAQGSEISAFFKDVKVIIQKSTQHALRYWQYDIASVFPDKQQ